MARLFLTYFARCGWSHCFSSLRDMQQPAFPQESQADFPAFLSLTIFQMTRPTTAATISSTINVGMFMKTPSFLRPKYNTPVSKRQLVFSKKASAPQQKLRDTAKSTSVPLEPDYLVAAVTALAASVLAAPLRVVDSLYGLASM